jgi:triosephosphate isomerase
MIFINYKAYAQGSGQEGVRLTKVLEEVSNATQVKIIPVVQILDAELIASSTSLGVWIQHIDPVSYGPYTGWTLPEEAVRAGIKGVFLNHSEHKFDNWEDLTKAVLRCREVDLKTLVFASDIEELKRAILLKPTYVAYEPAELVGSTETSVARAKPEVIKEAGEIAKEAGIPLIVGAGVSQSRKSKSGINRLN